MPRGILSVIFAIELAVFFGSMAAWSFALARKTRGQPFYPYQPRRPVPWGLFDLGLLAFAALSATVAADAVMRRLLNTGAGGASPEGKPLEFALLVLVTSVVSLLVMGGALACIRWRVGAGLLDFGIDPAKVDSDVGLGMIAFVMFAVPVFMIQIALKMIFPNQAEHPLIDMLRADNSPKLVLVSLFVAVIVAPLVEEYFFRVLLQGWLENVACRLHDLPGLLFGRCAPGESEPLPAAESSDGERGQAGVAAGDAVDPAGLEAQHPFPRPLDDGQTPAAPAGRPPEGDVNPYSASPYSPPQDRALGLPVDRPLRPRYWPIFVSAGLFAAMHVGNGYDPIPLFFLALGLGYLYQQTHRVIPCIVVHLLLNATSVLVLWLTITFDLGA